MPPPQCRGVKYVVVVESRYVEKFYDHGGIEYLIGDDLVATGGDRGRQHKDRSEPLAAGFHEVKRHLRDTFVGNRDCVPQS
jgi:hypothetical protein